MNIKTFSYRYAEEILQHPNYSPIYEELLKICKNCPLPRFPNKSPKQPSKDIIQQIMNSYFEVAFKDNDWEIEPLASPTKYDDALRADFRKTYFGSSGNLTLQIEVEFGNVSSSYRNYFKFQLSYANNLADIGILIVPSQHLSNRIDTGVANFEKTVRELPSSKLSTTVPILVIGLFDINDDGSPVEPWALINFQNDLNILKGTNSQYHSQHMYLVQSYYDNLNEPKAED